MADIEYYRHKLIKLILDVTSTYSYAKPAAVMKNGLYVFDEKICEIPLKGKNFIEHVEKINDFLNKQSM